jgi:hypothetical protein
MEHMDDNDFYEDDETIEERRAAWKSGERGETSGKRDLNQRAKATVDRAIERWDAPEANVETITVVAAVDWFRSPASTAANVKVERESTVRQTDRLAEAVV